MFLHCEVVEKNIMLWTDTHEMPYVLHFCANVFTEDTGLPFGEFLHSGKHWYGRGFTGSVMA